MTWTTDPPIRPGFYWADLENDAQVVSVEWRKGVGVNNYLVFYLPGFLDPHRLWLVSRWSERILQPEEPQQ